MDTSFSYTGNEPAKAVTYSGSVTDEDILSGFKSLFDATAMGFERIEKLIVEGNRRMDSMEQRMDRMEERMDRMERRIESLAHEMNRRFDRVDQQFDALEQRIAVLEKRRR